MSTLNDDPSTEPALFPEGTIISNNVCKGNSDYGFTFNGVTEIVDNVYVAACCFQAYPQTEQKQDPSCSTVT